MNLLAHPPNKIVDSRKDVTDSRKGLEKLVEMAVEKAFKLQQKSQKLVDIVDTRSCGEGLRCSFSPLASKVSRNLSTLSSSSSSTMSLSLSSLISGSRNWVLPKNSEDRKQISIKIHSLLLEWKCDFSFEWRSRVAVSVPIIEEAMYQQSKSKEDYMNLLLLDYNLKRVLCHFEAGNGPFLIQGMSPLYPIKNHYFVLEGIGISNESQMDQNASSHSDCSEDSESGGINIIDEAGGWERSLSLSPSSMSIQRTQELYKDLVNQQDVAVPSCTELVMMGNRAYSPHRKLVKRIVSMLSNKRKEDHILLKGELTKSDQNVESIAKLFAKAETKIDGQSSVKRTIEASESLLQSSYRVPHDDVMPTRSSLCDNDKVLDCRVLRANPWKNGLNMVELVDDDVQSGPESLHSDSSSSSWDTVVESENASSSSSSSSMSCALQPSAAVAPIATSSYMSENPPSLSSSSLHDSSSLLPLPQILPQLSVGATLIAPMSSTSTSTSTSCKAPSCICENPSSKSPEKPSSSSSSKSLEIPLTDVLTPSTSSFTSHENPSSSSFKPHEDQSSLLSIPSPSFPPSSSSSSMPLSSSVSMTSSSIQPNTRSSTTNGTRAPLSTFLAQRDELSPEDECGVLVDTSYEAGPWDTWEEPTEQLDPLCCVCMVGLKGACFVPCGHTFCRTCTRELWKGRGTCPLCNRYIREILDIY